MGRGWRGGWMGGGWGGVFESDRVDRGPEDHLGTGVLSGEGGKVV